MYMWLQYPQYHMRQQKGSAPNAAVRLRRGAKKQARSLILIIAQTGHVCYNDAAGHNPHGTGA